MIWLIGGTSDALSIADLLTERNIKILVSTTTSYGADLARKTNIEVIQQMLDINDMKKIIDKYTINTVIDASHPFASKVSTNAIEACEQKRINYIRFERKSIEFKNAKYYSSYQHIVNSLAFTEGTILLTIGSKNIHEFKQLNMERIIARVLPVKSSIEMCDSLGIKAHQIIALKGRINRETNGVLMQEYAVKHLVTKDSGEAGGLTEKVEAALDLGIEVHILQRPQIIYPRQFNDYEEVLNALVPSS